MEEPTLPTGFRFSAGSPVLAAHDFFLDHFPHAGRTERRHFIYLQGLLKYLEVGSDRELPEVSARRGVEGALEWRYRRRLKSKLRRISAEVILGWRKCKPGEAAFVERIVEGLLASSVSVLLVHDGDFPSRVAAGLREKWGDQLTVLSALPEDLISRKSFDFFLDAHEYRAFRYWLTDYEEFLDGFRFRPGINWFVTRNAAFRIFSECLVETTNPRLVWVRDSVSPLSAFLLEAFKGAGVHTVSMQACLVGAPFAEALPFVGDTVLTFGSTSARVIGDCAQELPFEDRPKRVLPVGSWIDPLPSEPVDTFSCQRVLLISQESSYFRPYFGVGGLIDLMLTVAEQLLTASVDVVLRPHPDGTGLDEWYPLLESFPRRFSVSYSGYPIHYDFVRSTAVLGLFSTAMPAAAAYGIPTFFLTEKGEHFTPELTCFGDRLRLTRESAAGVLSGVLASRQSYLEYSGLSLEAAGRYFAGPAAAETALSGLGALVASPD